jgi:hypothetical protein
MRNVGIDGFDAGNLEFRQLRGRFILRRDALDGRTHKEKGKEGWAEVRSMRAHYDVILALIPYSKRSLKDRGGAWWPIRGIIGNFRSMYLPNPLGRIKRPNRGREINRSPKSGCGRRPQAVEILKTRDRLRISIFLPD